MLRKTDVLETNKVIEISAVRVKDQIKRTKTRKPAAEKKEGVKNTQEELRTRK